MSDKTRLELPCLDTPADSLFVQPASLSAHSSAFIGVTTTEGDQEASVLLTKENARKLFNHLGVLLHKV